MKVIGMIMLLGLLLLSGCARRYIITLNNGTQITAVGKPRLQDGSYRFEDSRGNESAVASGRVKEIAPASMAGESSGFQYNPK